MAKYNEPAHPPSNLATRPGTGARRGGVAVKLYHRFDIDEVTPIQFVGVYATRWRPEWGEPTVMFREVEDSEALAFASQLDEVRALVEACIKVQISCDFLQCELDQNDPNVIAAREHIDLATAALAPFEGLSDG